MNAKKGEVIMVAKPYAYVLSMKERGKRCDSCFEKRETLLKCSRCLFARYCDSDCQKVAWTLHKEECKCLQRVAPKIPQDNVRLIFQVLQKWKRGYSNKKFTYDPGLRTFDNMLSHVSDIKKDARRTEQFAHMFYTLKIFCGNLFELPSAAQVLEVYGKVTVNSFTICDAEMQPIGGGVYLSPSYFDHNCSFNAVVTFNGLRLEVRALRDLNGEEVFISYIDQLGLTQERRRSLLEQYYFQCECDMCRDVYLDRLMMSTRCPLCPGPILHGNEGSLQPCELCGCEDFDEEYRLKRDEILDYSMKTLDKIETAKKRNKSSPDVILTMSKELLDKQDMLHEMNVFRVRTLDKAFDACIDLHKWEEALQYGIKTIEPYKRLYPTECHPHIGIQLMKIGKIQLYLEKFTCAAQSFRQSENVLRNTHGRTHGLYLDLKELIDQCASEMDASKLGDSD